MIGPGYDKQGRLTDALYFLNFAGVEVGTVPLFAQSGNPKPRMFSSGRDGVALNRFGFNSLGTEKVALNLARLERPGVIGINVGKNKLVPDEYTPWAYAAAIEQLYEFGDYFVICLSSPNTPGLRKLLGPPYLPQIIRESVQTLQRLGPKPLFVKTVVDLSLRDLDRVLDICAAEKASGIIDTNTTISPGLKTKYGWGDEAGGFSGRDPAYIKLANERMRHITRITKNTGLARIGVGGIHNTRSAIDRLEAGAQALQIVTAFWPMRPSLGRRINKELLDYINSSGARNVEDIVGSAV